MYKISNEKDKHSRKLRRAITSTIPSQPSSRLAEKFLIYLATTFTPSKGRFLSCPWFIVRLSFRRRDGSSRFCGIRSAIRSLDLVVLEKPCPLGDLSLEISGLLENNNWPYELVSRESTFLVSHFHAPRMVPGRFDASILGSPFVHTFLAHPFAIAHCYPLFSRRKKGEACLLSYLA